MSILAFCQKNKLKKKKIYLNIVIFPTHNLPLLSLFSNPNYTQRSTLKRLRYAVLLVVCVLRLFVTRHVHLYSPSELMLSERDLLQEINPNRLKFDNYHDVCYFDDQVYPSITTIKLWKCVSNVNVGLIIQKTFHNLHTIFRILASRRPEALVYYGTPLQCYCFSPHAEI